MTTDQIIILKWWITSVNDIMTQIHTKTFPSAGDNTTANINECSAGRGRMEVKQTVVIKVLAALATVGILAGTTAYFVIDASKQDVTNDRLSTGLHSNNRTMVTNTTTTSATTTTTSTTPTTTTMSTTSTTPATTTVTANIANTIHSLPTESSYESYDDPATS
ncbi:unnamed protein product [Allacma fusca]|uniref:Uncharacterized protein n=1 Tax=Allacma fusca TaxID=39272 RepID=A0A8J2NZY3_9HEXA|nr:unnamed protein product [Allacma fusca]